MAFLFLFTFTLTVFFAALGIRLAFRHRAQRAAPSVKESRQDAPVDAPRGSVYSDISAITKSILKEARSVQSPEQTARGSASDGPRVVVVDPDALPHGNVNLANFLQIRQGDVVVMDLGIDGLRVIHRDDVQEVGESGRQVLLNEQQQRELRDLLSRFQTS